MSDLFYEGVQSHAARIAELLVAKNKAYGDSINANVEVIKVLFPDGVPPEKMDDFLVVVRILDKLSRICRGDNNTFNEDAWTDLCGYALLRLAQKDVG